MNVYLIKAQGGFIPADIPTEEWAKKIKYGEVVNADFKKVRNYRFLKKYFTLMNIAFDNWETPPYQGRDVEKNFENFREKVTILAGYSYTVWNLDGTFQEKAKSISFANMEEEEFTKLYNATINVILKQVYNSKLEREELDNIVNQVMSFT